MSYKARILKWAKETPNEFVLTMLANGNLFMPHVMSLILDDELNMTEFGIIFWEHLQEAEPIWFGTLFLHVNQSENGWVNGNLVSNDPQAIHQSIVNSGWEDGWEKLNPEYFEDILAPHEENTRIALNLMSYSEYLKTDHWHQMRKMAIEKASGKCQICNSDQSLHVHHRTYARRGFEQLEDLTVLCSDCHTIFHSRYDLSPEQLADLSDVKIIARVPFEAGGDS